MLFPVPIIRIFMSATPEVIKIAPKIFRLYCLSFLALPLNVFSTYYFQSILKPKAAFAVSICRGLILSGSLILGMPLIWKDTGLWLAMPAAELIAAGIVLYSMKKYTPDRL